MLSRVTSASSGIGLFTITATERNRDEDSRDTSAFYRCTVCFRMCIRYFRMCIQWYFIAGSTCWQYGTLLTHSGLPTLIPRKWNNCVEQTYKVHNFCKISAVESQKGGGLHKFIKRQEPEHKHKQVILDCYRSEIFLLYNKSYIDQACWSRWPDISLVLFLFAF